VSKARESAGKIFQITDEKSTLDVRDASSDQIKEVKEGKIVFKDVDFKYPSRSTKIFNQFNMEIPPTFKIALVGHSGCGKSTITNLLLRFYHTHAGQILIDDEPIERYDVNSLREQIGFVQQEPVLFNRTIKENILYGQLDADNAKIRKVCEMANALTFIESNIEDLDKDTQIQRIKDELIVEIDRLCAGHPAFAAIKPMLISKSNEVQDVLLQILVKSDAKAIALFTTSPAAMLKQIEANEAGLGKGMRWDELVLRIEWQCEVEQLLKRDNLTANQRKQVTEVTMSMPYCFNTATFDRWLAL
jgi:ABC-type sugar transport system ATPase subunit